MAKFDMLKMLKSATSKQPPKGKPAPSKHPKGCQCKTCKAGKKC